MEMQERGVGVAVSGQSIQLSTLRVELVERINAEDLAALLGGVSKLYCLYRELDTQAQSFTKVYGLDVYGVPGVTRNESWVRQRANFADELIVSKLEIGTPNFIEWIGESKALKAVERALQAAAAVVAISGLWGYPPPPTPSPPVEQVQVVQKQDPFVILNEALEFTVKTRQDYLAGRITLAEYNRLTAMSDAATRDLLNGAPVVKIGPTKDSK